MGALAEFTLSFVLGIAVPLALVRWDVANLRGEQLARSWPDSSLLAAVVAFGPLCLPVHVIRTRRTWLSVLLALLWLVAALAFIALPVRLLAWIWGIAAPAQTG